MINSISKPKVRKGFAYVLKTSQLAQALSDAKIDCHVDLIYWTPTRGESILDVNYWLPHANVPYPRVYLRAGVVPLPLYPSASKALADTALPEFTRWLRNLVNLPETASELLFGERYFNARYSEDGLSISYQPVYMVRRRGK